MPPPAQPTTDTSRPGAYQVSRTTTGPSQVYRVTVPQGVRPGTEFTVHAGPRRVRVRCPVTSRPGQSLQITLPPEPETHHLQLRMAPLTAVEEPGGGAVAMTTEVRRVNEQAQASGGTAQSFLVTIPPKIYPGMQFTVNVSGQRFMVTCPPTAGPNMRVRIVPPTLPEEPEAAPKTQVFEVAVPPGVSAGQPFALVANGQRVLVTCPPNVSAGQKIRFQLPVSQVVGGVKLDYESEKGGWSRTIRASDLKFQWVRLDANESETQENTVDLAKKFDFAKSAYVRKITYLEGNDARMRTGTVELVPASEAAVDSRLVVHNRTLLSWADISSIQGKSLDEKTEWFQRICTQLTSAWEDGHIKFIVRRKHLLLDSVDAVMSLGREDLRKRWRIEFLGEPGIDAGGVTREWFELVTEQIFDPDFGLWLSSVNNQACVNINPASGTYCEASLICYDGHDASNIVFHPVAMSCPDDHLVYFRFLGRVLGRALFDRQLVRGHMVRTLYKHLLGWPVTFEDIKAQDEDYYKSLKKLSELAPDDVPNMCLDFTVTEESMGVRRDVELVPGGREKEVTHENLAQYLEANLKYRLLERTKSQLTELLLGFFDIIPEQALTVFDANELELILCGLPDIDMRDWMENTQYSGLYSSKGRGNRVVDWFWDIVTNDFDTEMKARLLQFVTGTSGVPTRGFSVLQGIDGNIKKFTIHGVERDTFVYPRAHTCFNRIDLPDYDSKKELYEKLKTAITMCGVGFDIE